MTDNELMRYNRIKNVIYLTLTAKSQGKVGWTINELATACSAEKSVIASFLATMKRIGFISCPKPSLFTYSKVIPTSEEALEKTICYITKHWGNSQSISRVAKRLYEFSDKELLAELKRRNLI